VFPRDAELVPAVRADMARYAECLTLVADRLADLGGSGMVRPAVGHALAFETWRLLVRREGLPTAGAVDAMLALVDRPGAEGNLTGQGSGLSHDEPPEA
jgi:hypothetical protein